MSKEHLLNMRDSFKEGLIVLHTFNQALLAIADEYGIASVQINQEEGSLSFDFCGICFRLWCVPLRNVHKYKSLIRWAITGTGKHIDCQESDIRDLPFTTETSQDGSLRYYTDPENPDKVYCDNPPHDGLYSLKQLVETVIDEMTEKKLAD